MPTRASPKKDDIEQRRVLDDEEDDIDFEKEEQERLRIESSYFNKSMKTFINPRVFVRYFLIMVIASISIASAFTAYEKLQSDEHIKAMQLARTLERYAWLQVASILITLAIICFWYWSPAIAVRYGILLIAVLVVTTVVPLLMAAQGLYQMYELWPTLNYKYKNDASYCTKDLWFTSVGSFIIPVFLKGYTETLLRKVKETFIKHILSCLI